jgi:hypothetical protein
MEGRWGDGEERRRRGEEEDIRVTRHQLVNNCRAGAE